jgi:hypothetical protein
VVAAAVLGVAAWLLVARRKKRRSGVQMQGSYKAAHQQEVELDGTAYRHELS